MEELEPVVRGRGALPGGRKASLSDQRGGGRKPGAVAARGEGEQGQGQG